MASLWEEAYGWRPTDPTTSHRVRIYDPTTPHRVRRPHLGPPSRPTRSKGLPRMLERRASQRLTKKRRTDAEQLRCKEEGSTVRSVRARRDR